MFALVIGEIRIPVPPDGQVLRVGRSPDSNIVCNDSESSRFHAQVRNASGALEIRDLRSTNGTLVNGHPIPPDVWLKLKAGHVIQVGSYIITVELTVAPAGPAHTSAPELELPPNEELDYSSLELPRSPMPSPMAVPEPDPKEIPSFKPPPMPPANAPLIKKKKGKWSQAPSMAPPRPPEAPTIGKRPPGVGPHAPTIGKSPRAEQFETPAIGKRPKTPARDAQTVGKDPMKPVDEAPSIGKNPRTSGEDAPSVGKEPRFPPPDSGVPTRKVEVPQAAAPAEPEPPLPAFNEVHSPAANPQPPAQPVPHPEDPPAEEAASQPAYPWGAAFKPNKILEDGSLAYVQEVSESEILVYRVVKKAGEGEPDEGLECFGTDTRGRRLLGTRHRFDRAEYESFLDSLK